MKTFMHLLAVAAAGIQISAAAATEPASAPAAEPYRIGVIIPLSGQNASLGHYIKKGIDLAYERLPEQLKQKIEVIFEDDGWERSRTVSAYQKLQASDRAKAVLVMGSASGNVIAPLAEKAGLIMVAVGASDAKIVHQRRYAFIHWVTPEIEAQTLVQEAKRRDYQKIGLITQEHEGAIAVYQAILQELIKQGWGGRIVIDEKNLPGIFDFKTFISKAKAKGAQVIVPCLFPGAISSFAKQARQMQLQADLAGVELFEDENEVKAAEGALLGQWYVNADEAQPFFRQAYQAAYNQQVGWGSANAFDTLNILAEGVKRFGGDNSRIADFMKTLKDYQGASGNYSASGDNRYNLPAAIKIVTRDGFKKLDQ